MVDGSPRSRVRTKECHQYSFSQSYKAILGPFLINRVQGERTRTREIDMELGNYLDWLGNQKGMITKRTQDKVNK